MEQPSTSKLIQPLGQLFQKQAGAVQSETIDPSLVAAACAAGVDIMAATVDTSVAERTAERRPSRMVSFLTIAAAFPIALLVLGQGCSAPFVKDAEAQSAEWIQDVASDTHLFIPHDYYGAWDRKPAMFFWLSGGLARLAGGPMTEARARAGSIVAAAAVAVEVLMVAAASRGPLGGWLAFLFLLGSYGFASRAALALTDMLLCLFVFSAWSLCYQAFEHPPSRRRTAALGLVLGLAVLTKGPVAIVLIAVSATIYSLIAGRSLRSLVRERWPAQALAIAVIIAALWYVPAFALGGRDMLRIAMSENLGHFLPARLGGTGEAARPLYYIGAKMIGQTMPIAVLVPALLVAPFVPSARIRAQRTFLFHASLVLAVVLLFTIASAKRDDYILPALPSLAILFSTLFTGLSDPSNRCRSVLAWLRDGGASASVLVISSSLIASLWLPMGGVVWQLPRPLAPADMFMMNLLARWARALCWPYVVVLGATLVAAIYVLWAAACRRAESVGAGLGFVSLVGVLFFTGVVRPQMAEMRTVKSAAAASAKIVGNAPVYVMNGPDYELSFYLGRGVPSLPVKGIPRKIREPVYLFAYDPELGELTPTFRHRLRVVARFLVAGSAGSPSLYEIVRETGADRDAMIARGVSE